MALRCSKCLAVCEPVEVRDREAEELQVHTEELRSSVPKPADDEEDIPVFQSRLRGDDPMDHRDDKDIFIEDVKRLYASDPLFSKVLKHPEKHPIFLKKRGLFYTKNCRGEYVLCVPKGKALNGQSLYGIIASQVHEVLGHFGGQ